MKKLFFTLLLLIFFSGLSQAEPKGKVKNDSLSHSKVITVHGMVCAFCANSLEKKFKKEEAVDQIKVDLKNKTVSVFFKKGKLMEDKKLKEIIASSGFKAVEIKALSDSAIKQ